MTAACHYSIVRFLPFIETGEFANVGVVMFAPGARFFGFKLLVNRYARVTNFFEQMNVAVFREVMRTLREELQRVDDVLKPLGTDRRLKNLDQESALRLWAEVIKPRESMLRFSESRLVLAADARSKLQELYQYYVERNFATREYQEEILERSLRGWLLDANLGRRFVPAKVGDDNYHARFPFVALEGDRPLKVIKPLNLAHSESSRIIDHGGQWTVRINALKKRGLLPAQVLFAVQGPSDNTSRGMAHRDVVADLESVGVTVAPFADRQSIIDFALQ